MNNNKRIVLKDRFRTLPELGVLVTDEIHVTAKLVREQHIEFGKWWTLIRLQADGWGWYIAGYWDLSEMSNAPDPDYFIVKFARKGFDVPGPQPVLTRIPEPKISSICDKHSKITGRPHERTERSNIEGGKYKDVDFVKDGGDYYE